MNMKNNYLFFTVWAFRLACCSTAVAQVQVAWVARFEDPDNNAFARALAVDNVGNVFVTGNAGTVKYDTNGNQLWVSKTNFVFQGQEGAGLLRLDNLGNLYVTGDNLTVKYDAEGNQLWAKSWAETLPGTALALDAAGNAYITGTDVGPKINGFRTVKYDANGNQLWDAPFRTTCFAGSEAIALDVAGNVYVAGFSFGHFGCFYWITLKYDSNGNKLWDTSYGGGSGLLGVRADESGNVHVTGQADYAECNNCLDLGTVKYDSDGQQLSIVRYSNPFSYLNAPNNSAYANHAFAFDAAGNFYVIGEFQGYDTTLQSSMSWDIVTSKFAANGTRLWSARYNGMGDDYPAALVVDAAGNVYVTGSSYYGTNNNHKYVTVKYDPDGNQLWMASYQGPNNYDAASALAVDSIGNVYLTGSSLGSNSFEYVTVKYVQTAVAGLPAITTQPESQTVVAGANVIFNVTVNGIKPLNYQWRHNGIHIPSATHATLALTNVLPFHAGDFSVEVRNSIGLTVSPEALLTITCPPPFFKSIEYLTNGTVKITLIGGSGCTYAFDWSENLHDWTGGLTFGSDTGVFEYIDTTTQNYRQRFYRAVLQP